MRVPTIKEVMHGPCEFLKYEDYKLWYTVYWVNNNTQHLFDFPIPVNDIGGGVLGPEEKAVTLMRWIRKHIEYLNKALDE